MAQHPTSILEDEDVGLIPGLPQWVKDLVLLQVADVAQILCCCGPGIGWELKKERKKERKKKDNKLNSLRKISPHPQVFLHFFSFRILVPLTFSQKFLVIQSLTQNASSPFKIIWFSKREEKKTSLKCAGWQHPVSFIANCILLGTLHLTRKLSLLLVTEETL